MIKSHTAVAVISVIVAVSGCAATAREQRGPTIDATAHAETADTQKVLVNRDKDGVAMQGYDPVAYFTESAPVKGSQKFKATHQGAIYYFASAEHRDLFKQDPEKYAPAFGGYCGYAASINRLSPIDPKYWQIVDDRLVLQHNRKAFDLWNKDLHESVTKADANWPTLVEKNGTTPKMLVNVDKAGVALEGYDPISYRTESKPVKGSPEFMAVYNGAIYHFVSMEHRVMFESNPARYAPAFGGYCGYAASINKVSPVNPMIYQIIDDRLVLQHTDEAYRLFNKDAPGSLVKADKNWPGLVDRKGK